MIDANELKYYIEDLQDEGVEALLSVRISKFGKETICGDRPSHVATVTCNPQDGWRDEDRKRIDEALHSIADVLKSRYVESGD